MRNSLIMYELVEGVHSMNPATPTYFKCNLLIYSVDCIFCFIFFAMLSQLVVNLILGRNISLHLNSIRFSSGQSLVFVFYVYSFYCSLVKKQERGMMCIMDVKEFKDTLF